MVTEHGGDVLKFCGDALIVIWSSGDKIRDACMATVAALHLQERAGQFEISVGVYVREQHVYHFVDLDSSNFVHLAC